MEEEGDESDDHSDHGSTDDDKETSGALQPADESHGAAQHVDVCDVPEVSIAVDPVHNVQPVKLMQALQKTSRLSKLTLRRFSGMKSVL